MPQAPVDDDEKLAMILSLEDQLALKTTVCPPYFLFSRGHTRYPRETPPRSHPKETRRKDLCDPHDPPKPHRHSIGTIAQELGNLEERMSSWKEKVKAISLQDQTTIEELKNKVRDYEALISKSSDPFGLPMGSSLQVCHVEPQVLHLFINQDASR